MIAELSCEDKRSLLAYARKTIASRLIGGPEPDVPPAEVLKTTCGAFVSLHEAGKLRGCIGRIVGGSHLLETIHAMALAAAFEDPRFEPLGKDELELVDLEITLLSPMQRIDDVSEIEVGRHGLYIVKGWHSGILLPQVAIEYDWDRATFLQQVCYKAGMQADAWRAPDAELFVFEGLVFGEKTARA